MSDAWDQFPDASTNAAAHAGTTPAGPAKAVIKLQAAAPASFDDYPDAPVPQASPSAASSTPTAADLQAAQAAVANATDPMRTMPLFGQVYGMLKDVVQAKPAASPGYTPSAVPLLDPISAFASKTVNSLPVVGPSLSNFGNQVDAALNNMIPGMTPETPQQRAQIDLQTQKAFPAYTTAGEFAGPALGYGTLAAYAPGAMGLSGSIPQQMLAGAGSSLGIQTADNVARGQPLGQAVQNAIAPSAIAGALPLGGKIAEKFIAQPIADAISNARQRSATNSAIAGAPASTDLANQASAAFDAGTGGSPPAISPVAIDRLVGNVQQDIAKFRINAQNDPQAVGLLKKLVRLQRDARTPGVVVDLKDLHLLRQSAGEVAQAARGRDKATGAIIIDKLDNFIASLKPADILGHSDPRAAAKALLTGIKTWSRAKKVEVIENAVKAAEDYASGTENGLRHQFLRIMKSKDFQKFSRAEQDAIREAAKGTTLSNIMRAIGKLGFSFGGHTGNNIIGGTIGAGLTGGVLTPILGPLAVPAGGAISMGVSAAARAASERMALNSANRAAQVFATPNIPSVARATVPSILPQLLGAGGIGVRALLAQPASVSP